MAGMSDCDKIEELILPYLTGDLESNEALLTEKHLAECPDCAKTAKQLEKTLALLKINSTKNAPKHLSDKVRRRLNRIILHPLMDWIYVRRKFVAWSCAVLAVIIVFLLAYHFQFKPEFTVYWINAE